MRCSPPANRKKNKLEALHGGIPKAGKVALRGRQERLDSVTKWFGVSWKGRRVASLIGAREALGRLVTRSRAAVTGSRLSLSVK